MFNIGYKYDYATIINISRKDKQGRNIYVLKCNCGYTYELNHCTLNLKIKKSERLSCGCHRYEDTIGDTFGKLKVLQIFRDTNKRIKALCECECGENTTPDIYMLLRGDHTKCWQCRKIDIKGQFFGNWLVLERGYKNQSNNYYWLCECQSCKGEKTKKYILDTVLKNFHDNSSCGCVKLNELNEYTVEGDVTVVRDNNGNNFLIDSEDMDKVKKYNWHINQAGYVITYKKKAPILLHRYLLDADKDNKFVVDHINHNTTDNRKINLRECLHKENIRNSKLSKANKSGVTGVFYLDKTDKWVVKISKDGVCYNLGTFSNKEDAIKTRLNKEKELFGEFTGQNEVFEKYNNLLKTEYRDEVLKSDEIQ